MANEILKQVGEHLYKLMDDNLHMEDFIEQAKLITAFNNEQLETIWHFGNMAWDDGYSKGFDEEE